jgi:hypothetical protein
VLLRNGRELHIKKNEKKDLRSVCEVDGREKFNLIQMIAFENAL